MMCGTARIAIMRPTVLMIDDHAGFRSRARAMLEAEGYDVVGEAADGEAGLVAADRLRPDIAIVDIGLPGLDGFGVAERLRSERLAVAIVLVSGRDRVDFGDRVEQSAADGFIAKADLSGERLRTIVRS